VDVAELFLETGLGCTLCAAHSAGRARSAHEAIKQRFFILNLAKALLGTLRQMINIGCGRGSKLWLISTQSNT
jgi:hypothetical protein